MGDGGDAAGATAGDNAAGSGCGRGVWPLALGIVFAAWACVSAAGSDSDTPSDDEYTAIAACRNSVEAQLKAPSTAEFSGEVPTSTGGRNYRVTGNVDAENGFGAMLRMTWTCTATPTSDGYRGLATIEE